MKILDLPIPLKLEESLKSGEWKSIKRETLNRALGNIYPRSCMYGMEQIKRETLAIRIMDLEELIEEFSGTEGYGMPGKVDLAQVLLIADVDIEEPIALYYYSSLKPPSVILLTESENDVSYWKEIAETFDEFYEKLILD